MKQHKLDPQECCDLIETQHAIKELRRLAAWIPDMVSQEMRDELKEGLFQLQLVATGWSARVARIKILGHRKEKKRAKRT